MSEINIKAGPAEGQPTYTEAFRELQTIVTEIERGEISVDQLSDKVKRAAVLIRICREKLTATEGDVNLVLQELESELHKSEGGRDAGLPQG